MRWMGKCVGWGGLGNALDGGVFESMILGVPRRSTCMIVEKLCRRRPCFYATDPCGRTAAERGRGGGVLGIAFDGGASR